MTLDCDEFRRNYDNWTVADHKEFYREVYEVAPQQSHSAPELVATAIAYANPQQVLEIGGWDGELAVGMLEQFGFIVNWTNVEICAQAVRNGHRHPRYTALSPREWFWERRWTGDMLVASHCIEHMSAEHLEALVCSADVNYFFFDAPLVDEPTSWWGSSTTHVLEVGWIGVTEIMNRHDYELIWKKPHSTPPESGGYACACLYYRNTSLRVAA
jgi:hypothetical protein